MSKAKVLVVEDDENIAELITYNLTRENYSVMQCSTGEAALDKTRSKLPDIILLDLMLPSISGLDVCKTLKSDNQTQHIPIIMVTAKGEESDVVSGLEVGADDYITKPFRPKELVARIRAVLRRKDKKVTEENNPLVINELSIDPRRREVKVKNKKIDLTYTEFQILHFLAQRPGWVFTRYQIVDAVRGDDYPVTDRSVDVQIVGLRKKLGKAGNYIETVRGVGYRFID